VGEGRGSDFDEAFGLARAIELQDGPAIANPAVRAARRLVRAQLGLRYAPIAPHVFVDATPSPGLFSGRRDSS
jgi:hypothetical protein